MCLVKFSCQGWEKRKEKKTKKNNKQTRVGLRLSNKAATEGKKYMFR